MILNKRNEFVCHRSAAVPQTTNEMDKNELLHKSNQMFNFFTVVSIININLSGDEML